MVLLASAFLCCGTAWALAAPSVDLQAPARNFGYFVGDTMDATAVILAEPGSTFDMTSLPAEGPISTWIDLRRIAVSQQQSATGLQVVLHLQYQSFFDPEEASQGTVPGFDVAVLSHDQRLTVRVPGFGFMASPFRHVLQPVIESSALQPDHAFLTVPLAKTRALTLGALGVAVAAALTLVARLGLLPSMRGRGRPFASAYGRIARLARYEDARMASRDAMLELHRAFDATAGRRLLAPDVSFFIAQHTRFSALKDDIEAFFAASRTFFFGAAQEAAPSLDRLSSLGRRLMRAERGS